MLPDASVATPFGDLRPEDTNVVSVCNGGAGGHGGEGGEGGAGGGNGGEGREGLAVANEHAGRAPSSGWRMPEGTLPQRPLFARRLQPHNATLQ